MALAVQQLWHDAPWYIWFSILCIGLLVIILGLAVVLSVHLNPLWNRIFLVTGVIFMCMGAFWYYETLPDHRPLSLVEVCITDFPQYFGQRGSYGIHGISLTDINMIAIKHRDFTSNSYFMSLYIYDTDAIYNACSVIARKYKDVLSTVNSQVLMSAQSPGDPTSLPDIVLQFTNIFYIYFVRELSSEQIRELQKQFLDKGLVVQFRNQEYLSHHLWDYDRRNSNVLRQFVKDMPDGLRP